MGQEKNWAFELDIFVFKSWFCKILVWTLGTLFHSQHLIRRTLEVTINTSSFPGPQPRTPSPED